MTVDELIEAARRKLDDLVIPYLWSDEELYDYLYMAIEEFCTETQFFTDHTSQLCTVPIVNGVSVYTKDERILSLLSAQLSTYGRNINLAVGANSPFIPYQVLPVYTGTALGNSTTTTLVDTAASFTDVSGYILYIVGGTSSGDMRTIVSNTTTAITVTPRFTTTPDNTSQYIVYHDNVRVGTPSAIYVDNVTRGSLVLDRVPDCSGSLKLGVVRMPLNSIFTNQNLELPERLHRSLIWGICYYAHINQNIETMSNAELEKYKVKWYQFIEKIKKEIIRTLPPMFNPPLDVFL